MLCVCRPERVALCAVSAMTVMSVWRRCVWSPCLPTCLLLHHHNLSHCYHSQSFINCVAALVAAPPYLLLLVLLGEVFSENELDDEKSVVALASALAKLTQLHTLNLEGEWSVFNTCVGVPCVCVTLICALLCLQ